MPTKDGEYWAERRKELLAQMEGDEAKLNSKLEKLYASEAAKLEREIASYYQRYGEKNVIEYRVLLASLDEADRALLIERMDEFSRKYPQWSHLMPVRETIYQLNELEGIQTSIRLRQLEIGAIEQGELEAHFAAQALRSANLAAEQLGFGRDFYTLNAAVIKATIGQAWSGGKAYSERVWDNREKLAAYLNEDFGQLIARGVTYDECVKELSGRFEGVSKRDIHRLVFTEGTFVFCEANAQVLSQEFGEYTVATAGDGKVCKICRQIAERIASHPVRYEDRKPGVNFPPFHPWCRCDTVPHVDDWDAWIEKYVAAHGGG
ncbi:MAG: minor capsid protein [Gordonibacter sp.]|uniref:minor capsid protein n=1 Tax=Gordonibacter sp. TaxID=1968902 RepID=UPI002FC7A6BE